MLPESEVRKMYDNVDRYSKEIEKETAGLFDKVSDMVSAEWALDRKRRLTNDYNIWINVRSRLASILEI